MGLGYVQAGYAGKALKYMVLPGIGPRLVCLFGSGFGMLAFLIASIYGMARLLPPGHPYLNPQNIGRFGIRHVVAEAANNLVLSRKNIDQIIMFGAVLLGIVLLGVQFIVLFYLMFMGSAHAGMGALFTGSIFATPQPAQDIALKMLDRVFGVPGMFGSCVDTTAGAAACLDALGNTIPSDPFPWPMHRALHQLFGFYSFAMLLVGVLIFLYFVVVVVLETATSGTPFGQRFQNIWVPIRLVVALGLLVPLPMPGTGGGYAAYNTGQYIALYAAKLGSGLATNGWLRFNSVIKDNMAGGGAGMAPNPTGESKAAMLGLPKPPSVAGVVQAMSLIHACAYTEWSFADRTTLKDKGNYLSPGFYLVQPWLVKNPTSDTMGVAAPSLKLTGTTTYADALAFFNDADIVIRFGHQNATAFPSEPGNVYPSCGEIRIPITSVAYKALDLAGSRVQRHYFEMVQGLWFGAPMFPNAAAALKAGAVRFSEVTNISSEPEEKNKNSCGGDGISPDVGGVTVLDPAGCLTDLPDSKWKDAIVGDVQTTINGQVVNAWHAYVAHTDDYEMVDDPADSRNILKFGWGGAAMWYNRVAEVNGNFVSAVMNVPVLAMYPAVMEKVLKLKQKTDANLDPDSMFTPSLAQGSGEQGGVAVSDVITAEEVTKAKVLGRVYTVWAREGADTSTEDKQLLGNFFRDVMVMILGVDGILNMRKDNAHVHPLAQLSMVGKGMVEHTIRNLAISNVSAFAGGVIGAMKDVPGQALANTITSIFSSTAFLGMTAGVTLYYIIPFLPFIYFFFAVGSWVKSVFEAMVGIPLWALAHLRLDGEGLPGDAASNGYFQILEIALRPILIVFGLMAAMIIFTAQVRILNYIWDLVIANVGGYSEGMFSVGTPAAGTTSEPSFKRDVIEQFGYTAIYTVIVYMLANSSFKLIDSIPNEATRWLGGGGSSFAKTDSQQNLAGQLPGYISSGGMMQGQNIAMAVKDLSGGAGGMVGSAIEGVGGGVGRFFSTGVKTP